MAAIEALELVKNVTGSREKVLVINNDRELVESAQNSLRKAGYEPFMVTDGAQGLRELYRVRPNLVLLGIRIPGMDGWEVCLRIRDISSVPIILVNEHHEGGAALRGFGMGIDDYIAKPFDVQELIARVQAILRRCNGHEVEHRQDAFHNEEIDINWASRQVWVRRQRVLLTPTEFKLLRYLVEHRGWVVTHDQVLDAVWGEDYGADKSFVKLYVRYLRQKIEQDPSQPKWILTERGVGYSFASS